MTIKPSSPFDQMRGRTVRVSITLDEARAILADESQPEMLRAAANTIISLYQAIANLEWELNYNREALR